MGKREREREREREVDRWWRHHSFHSLHCPSIPSSQESGRGRERDKRVWSGRAQGEKISGGFQDGLGVGNSTGGSSASTGWAAVAPGFIRNAVNVARSRPFLPGERGERERTGDQRRVRERKRGERRGDQAGGSGGIGRLHSFQSHSMQLNYHSIPLIPSKVNP